MHYLPPLQTDVYKIGHPIMFPDGTQMMYNNFTPRKSRIPGISEVVVTNIQAFIKNHLIQDWNRYFFLTAIRNDPKIDEQTLNEFRHTVMYRYKRLIDNILGKDAVPTKHLEDLWDLGYLPIKIKALPEGTLCPIGVPVLTYESTNPVGYFLPGLLETPMSTELWQPITIATIAHNFRKLLNKWAVDTTGSKEGVQWQGHDFSMRGMAGVAAAAAGGFGHLLSFTGTDTIPAIMFAEEYYGADVEKELIGASVPATEHSVMCMGQKDDEIGTFERLLDLFPKGILSVVSDTWDLWKVLTEYLPELKDKILAREGKLVIRPDSGDPVDIICGKSYPIFSTRYSAGEYYDQDLKQEVSEIIVIGKEYYRVDVIEKWHKDVDGPFYVSTFTHLENQGNSPEHKGVIQLLWDEFGGTVNDKGFKVLDPHIGAIYGDSIDMKRADEICSRLAAKGFASTNIVFGIGSYSYQYNTRDTFGFAVKATYGEVLDLEEEEKLDHWMSATTYERKVDKREIWKDPITDDGTKKSAKGLLMVYRDKDGFIRLKDQCTKEEADSGLLETVFEDGVLVKEFTLAEVRANLGHIK